MPTYSDLATIRAAAQRGVTAPESDGPDGWGLINPAAYMIMLDELQSLINAEFSRRFDELMAADRANASGTKSNELSNDEV